MSGRIAGQRWSGTHNEVIGTCAWCGQSVTWRYGDRDGGVILATGDACHDACRQALMDERRDR